MSFNRYYERTMLEASSQLDPMFLSVALSEGMTGPVKPHQGHAAAGFLFDRFYSNKPVSTDIVNIDRNANELASIVLGLVNGLFTRDQFQDDVSRNIAHVQMQGDTPRRCATAENLFMGAVNNMDPRQHASSESYWGSRLSTIILDKSRRPILVKKYYAESSALSLVPISIDGVEIPGGTIFGLELHGKTKVDDPSVEASYRVKDPDNTGSMIEVESADDIVGHGTEVVENRHGGRVHIDQVDAITGIMPLRLSMWVHQSRRDRKKFVKQTNQPADHSKVSLNELRARVEDFLGQS